MPLVYSADYNLLPKLSRRANLSPAQLLSFLAIFVVLVIQLFRDPSPTSRDRREPPASTPSADWFTPNPNIFLQPLPVSHPHKMTLLEEAQRVAAEFEYTGEDVKRGVKAFINQMGGLTWRMTRAYREKLTPNR